MYSQRDEEKFILAAFAGKTDGRFLDVGAWDGEIFSNTRALALAGWSGVLIEPSRIPCAKLRQLYNGSGAVIIEAAAGSQNGSTHLWESDDAISTTQRSHFDRWKHHAEYHSYRLVEQVDLSEIIQRHGPFDFVSIDTEGTSVDLFTGIEWSPAPRLICVEDDQRYKAVLEHGKRFGYRELHRTAENLILICEQ